MAAKPEPDPISRKARQNAQKNNRGRLHFPVRRQSSRRHQKNYGRHRQAELIRQNGNQNSRISQLRRRHGCIPFPATAIVGGLAEDRTAVPFNVAATAQLATEQLGASGERLMMFVLERTASDVSWSEATSEDRDTRRTIGSTSHRRPPGISRLSAIASSSTYTPPSRSW